MFFECKRVKLGLTKPISLLGFVGPNGFVNETREEVGPYGWEVAQIHALMLVITNAITLVRRTLFLQREHGKDKRVWYRQY